MATSSNRNLYLAAAVSCLTAALFGYSVGFIGGEIVLPSFLSHFYLTNLSPHDLASARSWSVTAWIVGALFGVPMGMPVCSRLGRRLCLQFAAVLYVIGAVAQVFSAGNLGLFQLGRLINGMGVGVGTLVSPIYISEISPASERGMLMSGYQVFLQSGALVGFWGAFVSQAVLADSSALQWQLPVAVQLVVGVLLLLGTLIVPESPRFLGERGHHQPMEESLAWLRRLPTGDRRLLAELTEIEEAVELGEKLKQHSFVKELKKKDVRYRLFVGVGLMVAQNMVGLNALNFYCPVIFASAGFRSVSSSLFLTGIFGVVKLVSSLAFMFRFVHVKGNRFWLKIGSSVCGAAMLVLAYYVRLLPPPDQHHEAELTFGGIISVLMVYVFAFSFGVSLGPISWNVCAEVFPLHINARCCAITTCTQWIFQIVIAAITPPLLAEIGWATYLIYAGFCILSFIWVSTFVPETRGVGVGKAMDELFGSESPSEDEEAIIEVSETTPLLVQDRRRRSSLAAYT
jgi:sugar porter (SP) family MFS transporter